MSSNPEELPQQNPDEKPQLRLLPRRQLIENQLTEKIDWTRDLVEHSRDLLCVHDLEGRLLSVSPVPARLLGYSVEEILQVPMPELLDPQFRGQFDHYLRQLASAGEATGILAVRTRTGQHRLWEYHSTLRTEGVAQPVVLGIGHDVTENIRAQKALLATDAQLLSTVQEREEALCKLSLFRALLDESHDAIQVIEPGTLRMLDVNERTCIELGYTREELLGMTVYDLAPSFNQESRAGVLQQLQQSGFAIIERIHRRKDGSTFPVEVTLREVQLDRKYGIAVARNITDRKRAETALLESHKKLAETTASQGELLRGLQLFRTLLDHSNDAIEVVDPATLRLLDVNEKSCAELGYTRDELLSMTIFDIDPQSTPDRVAHALEQLRKHGFVTLESVHRRKDGATFPVEVNIRRVQLDREYFVAISRDITERRLREERLQEYERVLETLDEMIVVVDRDHRYVLANQSFLNRRGLTRKQVIGSHVTKFLAVDIYEKTARQNLDEAFRGRVVDYEINYTYPRVGERSLEVTCLPVGGPAGIDRVAVVVRDVTERKRAAALLEESEKRFRAVHDRAPVGIAVVDSIAGRFLQINPKYCEIVGRTEEQMLGVHIRDITHPDDLEISIEKYVQLFEHKIRDYDLEKRYVRPDGRVVWVNLSVVPMWEPGQPAHWNIAIVQDITERKRAEEEIRQAKEKLAEEKLYLEQEIDTQFGFDNIVGQSHALKAVMESVTKVAASDATVLVLGETGTGKELIARAIHRLSRRAGNAFIKMNCAAIPTGLLESELFGHEKGAFTGAVTKKIGRLELADQGTILLDEIGEISLALQPKLLRVLQDQEFERLGGTQTLKIDFRLIAATNNNLAECVRDKEFRSDLYYRLNVFPIFLPPLRERREDIPLLVEHFVHKIGRRMKKSITSIPKKTMDALVGWSWPGNVRELENFLERSLILTTGSVLMAPLSELQLAVAPEEKEQTLEAAERRHILNALRETRGQISGPRGAATRLGLKRTTLPSKLKHLGIDPRVPS